MPKMPVQKPGKSKQDYGTPDAFVDAVLAYLDIGGFKFDLACHRDNKIRRALKGMIWPLTNSLTAEWPVGSFWHWLNPPFKNINRWVAKCEAFAKSGGRVAVLVPAAVGSNWWAEHVHGKAYVLFLSPRLTFKGTPPNPRTGKVDAYPKDCALLLYGFGTPGLGCTGYDIWRWK